MSESHGIADIRPLIGDPVRAAILSALKDGRALTPTELSHAVGIAPGTADSHLEKLTGAGMVAIERQGPHRYFRLANCRVAEALDAQGLAPVPQSRATGPRDPAMRFARSCYRHLAGQLGVALARSLVDLGYLDSGDGDFALTETGDAALADFGIDIAALRRGGRPLARRCLDWSERRPHLGGALGGAMLARAETLGWLERTAGGRTVSLTDAGRKGMRDRFSVDLEPPTETR